MKIARNVTVIPPTAKFTVGDIATPALQRRVAAYARVSTGSEEQQTSYAAQVDYYTKYIKSKPEWKFVSVYTDEGISATSTKNREGFNSMVEDALAGKIDLIITKSVSRFARNTVDSLVTVRKLKEKGVEVYFEKENIFTLDSKGELLITIMSSLAQEESRSISENVTWGQRKRFADGKVSIPYRNFLGYKKGENGLPEIVPSEAETVRLIYRLFMEGKTFSAIAKHLTDNGILTPMGKKNWQAAVDSSILQNEKYKGDALLQKTFCANFLTKQMVKNTGQIPQYYVENSHPEIIDPDEWDAVQAEISRRKSIGAIGRCTSPFAGKIICGDCGGFYGKKVWGSYKEDKTYRREVYRCNDMYKHTRRCESPIVTEEEIKEHFLLAFNTLMSNRDSIIEDCRLVQSTLCDTEEIDTKIAELTREIEVVTELSRKAIYENARTAQSQIDFNKRNEEYLKRHSKATNRIEKLEKEKQERLAKYNTLERFTTDIEKRPLVLEHWDKELWLIAVDSVIVTTDGLMTFRFKGGAEITT